MKTVWLTLESSNTNLTMKQHGFKPASSDNGSRNISLCGKVITDDEDGKAAIFETLLERGEGIKNGACKICLKLNKD